MKGILLAAALILASCTILAKTGEENVALGKTQATKDLANGDCNYYVGGFAPQVYDKKLEAILKQNNCDISARWTDNLDQENPKALAYYSGYNSVVKQYYLKK